MFRWKDVTTQHPETTPQTTTHHWTTEHRTTPEKHTTTARKTTRRTTPRITTGNNIQTTEVTPAPSDPHKDTVIIIAAVGGSLLGTISWSLAQLLFH